VGKGVMEKGARLLLTVILHHGGHSVPEETIRRRYINSISNYFYLYQPLADNWCFIDNSDKENPIFTIKQ
jgi:predicted ABC-type ATPase